MADEVIAAMQRGGGGGRGNRSGSRRQLMDDDTSSYAGSNYSYGQDSFSQPSPAPSYGGPSSYGGGGMLSPGMMGNNMNGNQAFPPGPLPGGNRMDDNNQWASSPPAVNQNASFVAPTQNQFKRNVDVHESMILDGRTRRFSIRIPWASYCMLRPYVCASAASAETGRIVGRAQQLNSDILVPTVLHTQEKSELPRSMTPKAINVSSLPPDAFMSFLFVIRLLDGRTLRSFHRFSEVRQFTIDMASALGAPLVEVGWFPWRNLHHSLVNVETRRAKLEAYLGMLFTHNQAMQSHPLTLSFFSRSGAADIQVGVIVPPPIKSLSSYNALQQASENFVTARSVVSTSKRLITVVVDIDLATGLSQPLKCAKEAAELLTTKLKAATHGDDMSDLRIISLEGVAPPAVVTSIEFALNKELGNRAIPSFNDEPNLQLLRAFHHADQSGEGVLKADILKDLLRNLGVHLPPEVTSDLLLQSYVDGETSALWNGDNQSNGGSAALGGGARGGSKLVDYHTFLSLVVARTQSRLIKRAGEEELLAAASMHAHINIDDPNLPNSNSASSHLGQEVAAVEVSSRAPFDWRNAGLRRFSVVLMASAHAGGAVAAAGGQGGGGGGITPMQEGSPAFLDFKNKVERGFEAKVHKMKWPKAAAMVHKAVGIDPEALNSADTSNKGSSHISNATNTNPFGEVNKPFLVVRARLMRVTDSWTKLVWFKQGMKGAVAKVGRAFNSGMVRPSDQPGAGLFDLLQVTQVRVIENPKSALGRWFLFKVDKTANGTFVAGSATVDRFFALIGLRESLYLEASSSSERDWMVAGFRQLLFGAEGRARARGFAHGRALESGVVVDPSHLSDMEGATGAAAASAIDQAMAAADASAHSFATGGSMNSGGSSQNALRLFERFDTNGSGTLDITESRNALRWANFVDDGPQGAEMLNRLFDRFDLDRNGTLDLREFSRLVVACEQGYDG